MLLNNLNLLLRTFVADRGVNVEGGVGGGGDTPPDICFSRSPNECSRS